MLNFFELVVVRVIVQTTFSYCVNFLGLRILNEFEAIILVRQWHIRISLEPELSASSDNFKPAVHGALSKRFRSLYTGQYTALEHGDTNSLGYIIAALVSNMTWRHNVRVTFTHHLGV